MDTENSLLQFKSIKKKRCVRRRNSSESSSSADDGGEHKDILQETLELQKLRKRAHGVNAVTLVSIVLFFTSIGLKSFFSLA